MTTVIPRESMEKLRNSNTPEINKPLTPNGNDGATLNSTSRVSINGLREEEGKKRSDENAKKEADGVKNTNKTPTNETMSETNSHHNSKQATQRSFQEIVQDIPQRIMFDSKNIPNEVKMGMHKQLADSILISISSGELLRDVLDYNPCFIITDDVKATAKNITNKDIDLDKRDLLGLTLKTQSGGEQINIVLLSSDIFYPGNLDWPDVSTISVVAHESFHVKQELGMDCKEKEYCASDNTIKFLKKLNADFKRTLGNKFPKEMQDRFDEIIKLEQEYKDEFKTPNSKTDN